MRWRLYRGGVEELIKRRTNNGVPKKPSHLTDKKRQMKTVCEAKERCEGGKVKGAHRIELSGRVIT